MTDWAAWGTTAGTLVLAGATFAAVRWGNRSARVAERTLLVGLRPLLVTTPAQDPPERVQFADGRTFEVRAGGAMVRREKRGHLISLFRSATSAPASRSCTAITSSPRPLERVAQDPLGPARHRRGDRAPDQSVFLEQQRDLYVPSADGGFWQAALRDPETDLYPATTRSKQ